MSNKKATERDDYVLDRRDLLSQLLTMFLGLQQVLEQVKELSLETREDVRRLESVIESQARPALEKECYSPAEMAELVGRKVYTVREWCRKERVIADKRKTGRGDAKEWEIRREEVERYMNHGLLPLPNRLY